MADVLEHRKAICVEFGDTNNNKFWEYTLFNDGTAETAWGRVGGHVTRKSVDHSTALRKWREKINPNNRPDKLYTEVRSVDSVEDAPSGGAVKSAQLHDIARKQITYKNPIVQKLVDYLVQVNAHQILSQSGGKIQYDASTATFKTPLGVVAPPQVAEARVLLSDMATWVYAGDYDADGFASKLNQYLRLIPHDVGMRKITPQRIFPNPRSVQNENDLLDGLETSFIDVTTAPKKKTKKKDDAPKVFEVDLYLVEDRNIIKKIDNLFEKSKKSMHYDVSKKKLHTVYAINIKAMREAFEKKGKGIGNIMQLWHGTKASNLLSIMRQGLIIPSANSAHCTGRMYGNGLYFSCISTKALNYATNFWGGGGRTNRTFMFLADVAMGTPYMAGSGGYGSRYPVSGYDSTWAKGGRSGVLNDEMIVYNLYQANLIYLCEFS